MRQVFITVVIIICLAVFAALGWTLLNHSRPGQIAATQASGGASTLPGASREVQPEEAPYDPAADAAATEKATPVVITGSVADQVAAIPNVDPNLVTWLRDWEQRQKARQVTSQAQRLTLNTMLADTGCSFSELFGIGDSIESSEPGGIAAAFYSAAVRAAEKELSALPPQTDAARLYSFHMHQMWNKMTRFLDGVTWEKIWRMQLKVDQPGSDDAQGSEMMLNLSIERQSYEMGHRAQLQTALDGFNSMLARRGESALNAEKKAEVSVCAAECYMSLNNYTAAMPLLEDAASHSTGFDAIRFGEELIEAKLHVGDIDQARQLLDQLQTNPDIKPNQLSDLEDQVKIAEKKTK